MNRILLKTFPNLLMAETVASQLRDAGYACTVQKTNEAGGYAALTTAEVYLEEGELLDDEEHRGRIDAILEGFPLTPLDEDAIAAMPAPEEEVRGPLISKRGWILIVFIALLLLFRGPIVAWFAGHEDVFPGGKIESPR